VDETENKKLEERRDINIMKDIFECIKEKKVTLAAHRGVCGGNIPCNSMASFKAAIAAGVEIVELDVTKSKDGKLFVLHPGMEPVHLRLKDSIRHYSADFVEKFPLSNWDMSRTEYQIMYLEDALKFLCDKCIVNIDKFGDNPEEITALIRKLGVEERVLIKVPYKKELVDAAEKCASDIPFMVYTWDAYAAHEDLMSRNLRYVGMEVLFREEGSPTAGRDFIQMMHEAGKFVWVNSIVYDYREVLAAGHNDDVSVQGDPEAGWGWLADRGYDIIQTDFAYQCRRFLEDTGRRNF